MRDIVKKLRFKKRIIACSIICVLIMAQVTGCSGPFGLFGEEEQVEETPAMDADTMFTVGNTKVSEAEWYLYLQPKLEEARGLYGEEIFDYSLDSINMTIGDALKKEVQNDIVYTKIVCEQAAQLGISLNEDEMIDVNLQVEDYMLALEGMPESEKEKLDELGIDEELIRKVYSDNQLATKVYEYLTLNVDTTIPEDSVRYMVLQYVAILKYKVDESGNRTEYSTSELETLKTKAESIDKRIAKGKIKSLNELSDDVAVSELIIDKAGLRGKLGDDIAEEAFLLKEGEISRLVENEDAFFFLECVSESDKDMTNAAKIAVIEERQATVFEESYAEWEKNTKVVLNPSKW